MIAISAKPVRECAGCELNLVKKCAFFEHPVLKWKNRKCEGYNDPALIEKYNKLQHPEGKYARKVKRMQKAKLAHTVVHKDGVRPMGKAVTSR